MGGFIIQPRNAGQFISARRLPSEYQQVEYIESAGNAFIDTGYTLSSNKIKYIAKARITKQGDYTLWGTSKLNGGWSLNPYANTGYGGNLTFWSNTSLIYGLTFGSSDVPTDSDFYIVGIQNDTEASVTVNSITKTATASAWGNHTKTYKLFANGDGGQIAHARIYYLELFDNNTLVRSFSPCYRKADNEIGMYDTVNGVFYTNQGTGSFTKGADIY